MLQFANAHLKSNFTLVTKNWILSLKCVQVLCYKIRIFGFSSLFSYQKTRVTKPPNSSVYLTNRRSLLLALEAHAELSVGVAFCFCSLVAALHLPSSSQKFKKGPSCGCLRVFWHSLRLIGEAGRLILALRVGKSACHRVKRDHNYLPVV